MEQQYQCKNCNWTGTYDELELDSVDTCMGNDTIEMCPDCGSYEVRLLKLDSANEHAIKQ